MATMSKQPASTLPARLRSLMKAMDWSRADLVTATGASRQAVSRWITDGHRTIDARYGFRLQRITGFCAEWILYGTGPRRSTDESDEFPALRAELLRHRNETVRILRAVSVAKRDTDHS